MTIWKSSFQKIYVDHLYITSYSRYITSYTFLQNYLYNKLLLEIFFHIMPPKIVFNNIFRLIFFTCWVIQHLLEVSAYACERFRAVWVQLPAQLSFANLQYLLCWQNHCQSKSCYEPQDGFYLMCTRKLYLYEKWKLCDTLNNYKITRGIYPHHSIVTLKWVLQNHNSIFNSILKTFNKYILTRVVPCFQ